MNNLLDFPFALLSSTIQKNDGIYRPVLALITRLPCAVRIVNVQKMSGRDLHPFFLTVTSSRGRLLRSDMLPYLIRFSVRTFVHRLYTLKINCYAVRYGEQN
jgi:hypothetical protein